MAESVKQICLIAHIITGKNVPKYLKQAKFNALLKKKDKKKTPPEWRGKENS
ncbi:peptide ABC transporter ATP-binding protein [Escherichia coli APEC O18]|nr:peptide ABC transporter ATP-binding protein [Escherichia coli APEC O18]